MSVGDSKPGFFRRLSLRRTLSKNTLLKNDLQTWNDLLKASQVPDKWEDRIEQSNHLIEDIKDNDAKTFAKTRLAQITQQMQVKEGIETLLRSIKQLENEFAVVEDALFIFQIVSPDEIKEEQELRNEIKLCNDLISKYTHWHEHTARLIYLTEKNKRAEIAQQQVFLLDKITTLEFRRSEIRNRIAQIQQNNSDKNKKTVTLSAGTTQPAKFTTIFTKRNTVSVKPKLSLLAAGNHHLNQMKQAFNAWFNPMRFATHFYEIMDLAQKNIRQIYTEQKFEGENQQQICHDVFVLLFKQLNNFQLNNFYKHLSGKSFYSLIKTLNYFMTSPEDIGFSQKAMNKEVVGSKSPEQYNNNVASPRIGSLYGLLTGAFLPAFKKVFEQNISDKTFNIESFTDQAELKETSRSGKKFIKEFVVNYYSITKLSPMGANEIGREKTNNPIATPQLSIA